MSREPRRPPRSIRRPPPTARSPLRLLLIYALEVIENRAPFVGGEATKLVPVRLPELRRILPGGIGVRRRELFVPFGGTRFPLVAVLTLILLERASRVEQSSEELLLPGERGAVDAATLHCVSELACLLRQLGRPVAARAFAHIVQLLRDATLLARKGTRGRLHLARHLATRHRHETLRLRVDRSLLLRHFLQLLQHLGEAGRRRRRVHALAVARERRRGAIERLGGVA